MLFYNLAYIYIRFNFGWQQGYRYDGTPLVVNVIPAERIGPAISLCTTEPGRSTFMDLPLTAGRILAQ